jgi:hypothetical protein
LQWWINNNNSDISSKRFAKVHFLRHLISTTTTATVTSIIIVEHRRQHIFLAIKSVSTTATATSFGKSTATAPFIDNIRFEATSL